MWKTACIRAGLIKFGSFDRKVSVVKCFGSCVTRWTITYALPVVPYVHLYVHTHIAFSLNRLVTSDFSEIQDMLQGADRARLSKSILSCPILPQNRFFSLWNIFVGNASKWRLLFWKASKILVLKLSQHTLSQSGFRIL